MSRTAATLVVSLCATAALASCESCTGAPAGASCLETDECADELICCPNRTENELTCQKSRACGPVCDVCGTWTERYSCSGVVGNTDCAEFDLCFDDDACGTITIARGEDPGTYVTTDGFLVGTLDGRTLTWRGETESDPGVDTGYVEVGTLVFNASFTEATGSSCYVVDDAFDPALGDTGCEPLDGSPGWQMAGDCTQALVRGNAMPAPPADVGCCTGAPAESDACN